MSNKEAVQTVCMGRLVCSCVVRMQQNQVLSRWGPYYYAAALLNRKSVKKYFSQCDISIFHSKVEKVNSLADNEWGF